MLDHSKKELVHDLTNKVDHAHNQSEWCKDNDDKLWIILLNSQSTFNVIINKHLLTNIHKCEWKLKLQNQAGEFYVDYIG